MSNRCCRFRCSAHHSRSCSLPLHAKPSTAVSASTTIIHAKHAKPGGRCLQKSPNVVWRSPHVQCSFHSIREFLISPRPWNTSLPLILLRTPPTHRPSLPRLLPARLHTPLNPAAPGEPTLVCPRCDYPLLCSPDVALFFFSFSELVESLTHHT